MKQNIIYIDKKGNKYKVDGVHGKFGTRLICLETQETIYKNKKQLKVEGFIESK